MRTKSLVTFRSKCADFEEGKMEKGPIPDPSTVWEALIVTEEQIQALADRGLLRPKSQVGWRLTVGEEFPTEGTGETIIFLMHIERGFDVPTSDFLWGLLHFYRIELVHQRRTRLPSSPPSSTSARPTSASRPISIYDATPLS
jgi:hypothetical protein